VDNLQKELEGLMDTMREMNARQDELVSAQEADQRRIDELSEEAKEYKTRYESAKTELRNLKGKLHGYSQGQRR
jgi:chromosome segregation ATPase